MLFVCMSSMPPPCICVSNIPGTVTTTGSSILSQLLWFWQRVVSGCAVAAVNLSYTLTWSGSGRQDVGYSIAGWLLPG
jgi:hypothetical protein